MSADPRSAEHAADSDPIIVCRVTPDGEVICEGPPTLAAATVEQAEAADLPAALAKAFPEATWGPNKTALALHLLEVIARAKLDDARIPRRDGQCAGAVADLLLPEPPSILLFNYSEQPGDVMGAWYQNRAQLMRMQHVLKQFDETVKP
jgi:hypothetical protein